MKERNKLIIAIIAVILIIVIVVGATYAYWQWTSNEAQNTSVTFTVPNKDSQLSASLKGGATTTVNNLAPAACTNSNYAMKKQLLLTYANNTDQTARVKATLTITSWTAGGTFQTGDLPHIHYAVTTSDSSCTTGTITGMTGTFPNNAGQNTVLINNVVLKNAIAAGGSATDEQYYLYVWLDTEYEGENTGNTISDPMQKLSFQLTWTGTIENYTSS